jgi:hypothetical protein
MWSFQPFVLQETLMMVYYAYFDSIMDMELYCEEIIKTV